MATVNFSIKSKKRTASLYARFQHEKIDLPRVTPITVFPELWDASKQQIKKSSENATEQNNKIAKLRIFIIEKFNIDYGTKQIDSAWMQQQIDMFFNRPAKEIRNTDHLVYFTKFAEWYLENQMPKVKDEYKRKYRVTIARLKEYEPRATKLDSFSGDIMQGFVDFLAEEKEYAPKMIERMITRIKFFLIHAEQDLNLQIHQGYKKRLVMPSNESDDVYLNEAEINEIYHLGLPENSDLDHARDLFVISAYTALRISDLMKLSVEHFDEEFITITTQKTKRTVKLPIHDYVNAILSKRNFEMPKKFEPHEYNTLVREVCRTAGITQPTEGRLYDKNKKRKIAGVYPKWKLISSHSGRRSFVTNHLGRIPNHVLASLGWSDESLLKLYAKHSKEDNARALKKAWESQA